MQLFRPAAGLSRPCRERRRQAAGGDRPPNSNYTNCKHFNSFSSSVSPTRRATGRRQAAGGDRPRPMAAAARPAAPSPAATGGDRQPIARPHHVKGACPHPPLPPVFQKCSVPTQGRPSRALAAAFGAAGQPRAVAAARHTTQPRAGERGRKERGGVGVREREGGREEEEGGANGSLGRLRNKGLNCEGERD